MPLKNIIIGFFIAAFCAANSFGAADTVISRAIPVKNNVEKTDVTTETTKNRVGRRVNVARNTTNNVVRGTEQKSSVSVVPRGTRKVVSRQNIEDVANQFGRNVRTEADSMNSNPAVRRAGVVLRATTAEVGGRAKIIGSDTQTGSNIDEAVHNIQGRASISLSSKKQQQKMPTAESITQAKENLEKIAELNNTCQQQYNECMDQFCMVIDSNQKRCC